MVIKQGNNGIISGTVSKDAEYKRVGSKETPLVSFSVTAGKREDSTTIFINCQAWRDLAIALASLKKGDDFMGLGRWKSREYNGKTYTDLVLESGWSTSLVAEREIPAPSFEEEDGDLPDSGLPF